jgi:hypothetical protein
MEMEENYVTGDNNNGIVPCDAPLTFCTGIEQYMFALDSKHPVLNGRGKDIRRIYKVKLVNDGVEHTIGIVACFLNDAYKVFENVYGKPAPEVIEISSTGLQEQERSVATEAK